MRLIAMFSCVLASKVHSSFFQLTFADMQNVLKTPQILPQPEGVMLTRLAPNMPEAFWQRLQSYIDMCV